MQAAAQDCLQRPLLSPLCNGHPAFKLRGDAKSALRGLRGHWDTTHLHRHGLQPWRALLELCVRGPELGLWHGVGVWSLEPRMGYSISSWRSARACHERLAMNGNLTRGALLTAAQKRWQDRQSGQFRNLSNSVLRPILAARYQHNFPALARLLAHGCPRKDVGRSSCSTLGSLWAQELNDVINLALFKSAGALALPWRVTSIRLLYAFCELPGSDALRRDCVPVLRWLPAWLHCHDVHTIPLSKTPPASSRFALYRRNIEHFGTSASLVEWFEKP